MKNVIILFFESNFFTLNLAAPPKQVAVVRNASSGNKKPNFNDQDLHPNRVSINCDSNLHRRNQPSLLYGLGYAVSGCGSSRRAPAVVHRHLTMANFTIVIAM